MGAQTKTLKETRKTAVPEQGYVLVTGATGFVGRPLVQCLLDAGRSVRATVRRYPESSFERLQAQSQRFEYLESGDIDDQTNWSDFLHGVDEIVHLVSRVHVRAQSDGRDGVKFFRSNVATTMNLVEAAIQSSVKRIIYISTIKVHGEESSAGKAFQAADVPQPQGVYGRSKLDAEQQLFTVTKNSDLEVVVIRPPLVYGPAPKGNFASLLRVVQLGLPLPLGGIHNQRSLISVFNLCDCIRVCLTHAKAAGEVFLVSDGCDVSTPELIRLMAKALGKKSHLWSLPPGVLRCCARWVGRGEMMRRLCDDLQVDIEKTKKLLGWSPPYSLEEGLRLSMVPSAQEAQIRGS